MFHALLPSTAYATLAVSACVSRAYPYGALFAVAGAANEKPGSGGEHPDPGWLSRAYGEEIRQSDHVPDHAGERITHSPVVTPACRHARPRIREQQSR